MEKQEKRETKGDSTEEAGRGRVFRMTGRTRRKAGEPGGGRVETTTEKPRRSCRDCVFCIFAGGLWLRTLMSGFPLRGMCVNHPDTPGQWCEVPGRPCRNFRAKVPPVVRAEPPAPPSPLVCYIPLTRGLHAIVDAADYPALNRYRWHAQPSTCGRTFYARRNTRHSSIFMHRMIMRPPKGMVVDHINGNGLDNRCCNLRICTAKENSRNGPKRAGAKSRFIGVYPRGKKWGVCITCDGENHELGPFNDEVEAAKARDHLALELHGIYARLNFPPASPPDAQ